MDTENKPLPDTPPVGRPWLWWGCALMGLPLTLVLGGWMNQVHHRRGEIKRGAVAGLVALAEMEEAYAGKEPEGEYGTLEELRAAGYIPADTLFPSGYDYYRTNTVEGYDSTTFQVEPHRFTIILEPDARWKGHRMMAVCEDGVVRRKRHPNGRRQDSDPEDPRTWTAIQ